MHNKVYLIWKDLGKTPLQQLREFRYGYDGELPDTLTYAGRLDPMAEGLLPVVDGKNLVLKKKVSHLDKEYEASILLGVKTDSLDLLGKIEYGNSVLIDEELLAGKIRNLTKIKELRLPRYSSKAIALHGLVNLEGVELGNIKVVVYSVNYSNIEYKRGSEILKILEHVEKILEGSFRHKEIQKGWRALADDNKEFPVVRVRFRVGSGTYIRSLAGILGEVLGYGACLYSLRRVKVGKWSKVGEWTLS